MTRKSRRDLEQAIEGLAEETSIDTPGIVWEDAETGEWYADADLTGEPLEKATTDPLCVIQKAGTDWERGPA